MTATREGEASSSSSTTRARYRLQWYQNADAVSVEIFVKGTKQMPSGKVRTHFEETGATVEVDDGHADGPYKLELKLQGKVLPEETKVELLSTKIEIKLAKADKGAQWADLEEGGEPRGLSTAPAPTQAVAPPGKVGDPRKKSPAEWAALEAEIKQIEKEDKPEGEQALQALFKDIYGKADEDTQKAMIKSFQESNGTVLSTNWNEVGGKKVEVQPPDGMVSKKYEQ